MSFPTKPAFVHVGDWDADTRKHPAMKFMEDYTVKIIDKNKWDTPYAEWMTDDFTWCGANGSTVSGGDAAWKEGQRNYAPFTGYEHHPYFLATLYANLPGEPGAAEKKFRDKRNGKEWDVALPGGFHFLYVKDDKAKNGNGYRLKRTGVMSDSGPVVVTMLKRGVLKPTDLGL